MQCLTSGKPGQLFDLSTSLCVEKKALYTWSQSSFNAGRLASCTLYLLTIATNSLTTLRQVYGQQAENSTFPLFLWKKSGFFSRLFKKGLSLELFQDGQKFRSRYKRGLHPSNSASLKNHRMDNSLSTTKWNLSALHGVNMFPWGNTAALHECSCWRTI